MPAGGGAAAAIHAARALPAEGVVLVAHRATARGRVADTLADMRPRRQCRRRTQKLLEDSHTRRVLKVTFHRQGGRTKRMRSAKGSSSQHEALDDYLRTDELIARCRGPRSSRERDTPTAGPRDGRRDPHDQSNGCETLKKNCSCYEKGSYCSGDTRDSGLIPHKTSPHSLLSYDTTLRPWARFPFDSPQAPNCFAARC